MIFIVDKKDLNIVSYYEGTESKQSEYGGPWGNPDLFEHKAFDGDSEVAKAKREGDRIVVEVDTEKKAELDAKRAKRGRIDDRNVSAETFLKTHYEKPATSQFEKAVIELLLKDNLEPEEVKNG